MNINGTNKADTLIGTSGDDFISGGRGADWFEGGHGNDTLDLTDGNDTARDKVVFRFGDGHDTVIGFTPTEDKFLVDSGTRVYADVYDFGAALYDGAVLHNWAGTSELHVSLVDADNDGAVDDTRFELFVDGQSGGIIDFIDIVPTAFPSADIMGG